MDLDYYKILHHFTIGVDILFVFLLLFNWLSYLPGFWNMTYIFFAVIAVNTIFLAFKINKIPEAERKDSKMIYYFSHFFLLSLVVIVLNQFLKRQFIIDLMPEISALAIGLGFLTFYAYRNKVEKEIEQEEKDEKSAEVKRYNEFDKKFLRISRIWGLRRFVRWMYKEGWVYSVGLIAIVVLGFVLRIWNLNYLQGADNFNLLSAKALFQTGSFVYPRNLQITYTLAFLFKIFGTTLAVARIPFVIIGTSSIFLIYFLGRFINKKIGIISSFLLAISPVAIEKSSYVREYAENFFWILLLAIIFIFIFQRHKNKPKKFFFISSLVFLISSVFLFFYGQMINNEHMNFVLLIAGLLLISTLLFAIKLNYKKIFFPMLVLIVVSLLTLLYYIQIFSSVFVRGLVYNIYWLKMFFDPMVQTPMQWFSFSSIPFLFLIGLFLLPLIFKSNKKEELHILIIVFFITISLFIFKVNFQLFQNSRYLFPLYPFYITIFSAGLFYFLKGIKINYDKFILILIVIFLLVMVIIPQNTLHGARHDLSIWSQNPNLRQPTAVGNANYFYDIFNLLEQNNFSNKDIIVIRGENQFFISWYFNYTINRTFKNNNRYTYDTGDKVYLVYPSYNLDELDSTLNKFNRGYLLSETRYYGSDTDFIYNNSQFIYLGNTQGYYLYFWNK